MKMTWVCLVCEKGRPQQWMRSRRWIGICIGCDEQVNDSVVRVLKLRAAHPPAFSIKKEVQEAHAQHSRRIQSEDSLNHQDISSNESQSSIFQGQV